MGYLNDQTPADTDAVKNGAGFIRSLQTALNVIISKIFDNTGNFLTGWITSSQIGSGAVTAPAIAAGAVGQTQLAAGAVGQTQLAAGAVGPTQLATAAVMAPAIAAGAVVAAAIGAGAVTAPAIAAGAVGQTQLAAGAVGQTQLAAGATPQTLFFTSVGANNPFFNCGFVPDFAIVIIGASAYINFNIQADPVLHPLFGSSTSVTITFNPSGLTLNGNFSGGFLPSTVYVFAFKAQS